MMPTTTIRPVDRARGAAAIVAAITRDGDMLDTALADAAIDTRPEAIHLLLQVIAEDVAVMLIAGRGVDGAAEFARTALAEYRAAAEAEEAAT